MFIYLELLQTALLAAITVALWRKAVTATPAETEQPDVTPGPTPDPTTAPAAPRPSRPLYPRRYEKMLQDMLTRFHNEFFHQLGQMQNPPMGGPGAAADTPAGGPATPPNVSHRWDSPQGRPVKVPRPTPTPRGDCAFLVKRGDQVIGTRPAGHPDELEALSCDRLHVEYLEGDNS